MCVYLYLYLCLFIHLLLLLFELLFLFAVIFCLFRLHYHTKAWTVNVKICFMFWFVYEDCAADHQSQNYLLFSHFFPVVIMASPRLSFFNLPLLFPALPVIHKVYIFTILSNRLRYTSFVWYSVNQPQKLWYWPYIISWGHEERYGIVFSNVLCSRM